MGYLNATWTGDPILVPRSDRLDLPGNWVPFKFDYEYADASNVHTNGSKYIMNNGPWYIDGILEMWLVDFDPEVEIQLRQFEDDTNGNRVETDMPDEFYTSRTSTGENYPRTTHKKWPVWTYLKSGHKFGIECSQWSDNPDATVGKILKAQIRVKFKTSSS